MASKKTFSFAGKKKTSIELNGATELLHQIAHALGDGRTEFVLTYEKKDDGSVLTLNTTRRARKGQENAESGEPVDQGVEVQPDAAATA